MKLSDIVKFCGDLLFNGAVQIEWFESSPDLKKQAAEHFVFHGPEYHGVSQSDVAASDDHALIDTASFVRETLEAIENRDRKGNPFALAIAGYGTGKSHLALTLSTLLSEPKSESSSTILRNIGIADSKIRDQIYSILVESDQPYLVLAINGMSNFDLAGELTRQIIAQVRKYGLDPASMEELRPRFKTALGLLNVISESIFRELSEGLNGMTKAEIAERLEEQDESIFAHVSSFFEQRSMPIPAVGRESIQELLDIACSQYCGSDRFFRSLLIVFDEFGRYSEFATQRSQVAGSGALQQMFEGIQRNSEKAFLIGLIQFELNAYLERIAPEFKNEITRVITRYQTSRKYYLSVNLETLIAHVIEKQNTEYLDKMFSKYEQDDDKDLINELKSWFPQIQRHSLWCDPARFKKVIQKGCWPLSPTATWLLYHLTASGKYLQQRSAMNILSRAFERIANMDVPDHLYWTLSATQLWSNELLEDLLSAEEYGKQGAIAHAYATVCDRYENRFTHVTIELLRAITLSSKMGLTVSSKEEAIKALCNLSGVSIENANLALQELQNEYNVVEWDDNFKHFEIVGDAVPRTQFHAFLRSRVGSSYDNKRKASLFASKAKEWCDLLQDIDTDFGNINNITTKEWSFTSVCSNTELLETHINYAINNWIHAYEIDKPRGQLIYCYVGQDSDLEEIRVNAVTYIRRCLSQIGQASAPILIVILHDADGRLGQALAEYAVLNENLTADEKSRFGNFILSYQEKSLETIRTQISSMVRQRFYISNLNSEEIGGRLSETTTKIFEKIYPKTIPFPFDGFHTARGNAADDCQLFIRELLMGGLDHGWYTSQPSKVKNRADSVLNECWQVFSQDGKILKTPANSAIGSIIRNIDSQLRQKGSLNLGDFIHKHCQPPFGGNIASVGLLLGVFILPRLGNLIVEYEGHTISIENWLKYDIFKSKFLSLDILTKTNLAFLSQEVSEEWENLLDGWEQVASHKEKLDYLQQARELNNRLTIPPLLHWKYEHLADQSRTSIKALSDLEKNMDKELEKLENGYSRGDVNLISWAGAELTKLRKKIEEEGQLWLPDQLSSLDPHIGHSRQAVIQFFNDWLSRQTPISDRPEHVGDFKHKMLNLLCPNLETLNLPDFVESVKNRTSQVIRQAELLSDVKQLIREIETWINTHTSFSPLTKIIDLDEYLTTTNDFTKRLRSFGRRVEIPQIEETQALLNDFISKCKETREAHMNRAKVIWNLPMNNRENIEEATREVNAILDLFAGKDNDLDDFLIMKRVLTIYAQDFDRLSNLNLSWSEFENNCERLTRDCLDSFSEDEPPWDIEETYSQFRESISSLRMKEAERWIDDVKRSAPDISNLSVSEANRILERLESSPAFLTESNVDEIKILRKEIEQHLSKLAIDWLIARFLELTIEARQEFLKRVNDIL